MIRGHVLPGDYFFVDRVELIREFMQRRSIMQYTNNYITIFLEIKRKSWPRNKLRHTLRSRVTFG